jgi:2-polyprenyl-6-methoxyphenol hydroxylase-like FAD-dependent oxidoreductase
MNSIGNVLIVGGGIAGLTAANALARQGVTCEVVELYDRPVGAAITLLNRAIDGLHEIGVLDRFIEEGMTRSPQEMFTYYDAAGNPVPTPPMPPRPPSDLPPGIIIYRPTMMDILREHAEKAGVPVRRGVGLARLEQAPDSVTATLTDGTERSCDLLLGADGIRSTTRQQLWGDEVVPTYSGQTMFRWVVDGVPDVGPPGFYQAKHLLVVLRLRDGRLYLATGRDYPDRPRIDAAEARRTVRGFMEEFTAPIVMELRKRLTDDQTLIVNDYDWLLTPNPWYRGRVLLIGDAAHATTAHLASGGGMAIEDAAVLGQEVAAGGSLDEMLERFMQRRFERVRLVVETSVELGRMLDRGESVQATNQVRGRAMGVLASPY